MSRYKIMIKYDGTNYFGWQIQLDKPTIQSEIEKAISPLNDDKRVAITGAGRTDTGVHAFGQVAHFNLESKLSEQQLLKAINARLPLDIRIPELIKIDDDFHARYSAKKRYYTYQCYYGENLLYNNQAWKIEKQNVVELNRFAEKILGKHDFLSFSKLNKQLDNTICEIFQSEWFESEKMLTFKVCGNRFLHHMVRYLVGTMIAGMEGKISIEHFVKLLDNPQNDVKIFKAPPQGLILIGIDYD